MHASWLEGKGFQGSINLYEADVTDLSQALLQSIKAYAFTKGRYDGCGPSSAEKLASRVNKGQTISPQNVGKFVSNSILGTPMQNAKEKVKEHVARSVKRKKPTHINAEENNATHRPDYVFEEMQQRKQREQLNEDNVMNENMTVVLERQIHKMMWAICRTPKGNRVQCQG